MLVRRSKSDQHGQGQDIAIWANPTDPLPSPLAALDAWLAKRHQARNLDGSAAESARYEPPLFCAVTKAGPLTGVGFSNKAIAFPVNGTTLRAGLDPERYSGHSLRAGLAIAAGDADAALPNLMRQARHRSTHVALAFLRPADLWRNNATRGVFTKSVEIEE